MSKNAEKWVEHWSQVRERGVSRFILWRGLVGFGLPFAALISILNFALDDQPFETQGFLIRFIIGGSVFGALTWRWHERKYRNHQSTDV